MRTTFQTPAEYASVFLKIAEECDCISGMHPGHFERVMRMNRGTARLKDIFGDTEDGLEYKNPLVVALGDSVTAGHFESVGNLEEVFQKIRSGALPEETPVEVTDARVCYLEQFRAMLIDKYEQTSVSTINSGIAGDTVIGMKRRVYRDVIRYQPDLVIINAALNWGPDCGGLERYALTLSQLVRTVRSETRADIVLLTPNMEAPSPFMNRDVPLRDRVQEMRKVAAREHTVLVDVYRIWEEYAAHGYPLSAILANGINHPSVTGHEVYARALMKMMK